MDTSGSILTHWLRNVMLATAAFVLLFVITGISYQAIESRADARRFHQEGRSVDVGGYRLNINCTGSGSPTVVLESGGEVPATGWHLVQPGIAMFARVCSYDRAGYGWSDPGPMPRTSDQIVKELHTLLQNAGERPPFLLVGHSSGTGNVLLYNARYPIDVVGLVLAEGAVDLKPIMPASIWKLSQADLRRRKRNRTFAPLLYHLGISRFLVRKDIEDPTASHEDREWSYDDIQPKMIEASTSEIENGVNGEELKDASVLGDKPLIVLIAGKGMFGLPLTSPDWVELRNRWVNGLMGFANQSSRGKWIMVPDTGHMIPDERPDAIVSAVRELTAAVH